MSHGPGSSDPFYEWLLSDAPAAKAERSTRRRRNAEQPRHERAEVTAWCRRILANDAAPPHLRDLAETMQRVVSRSEARETTEVGLPDDEWVRRERQRFETSQRVAGNHDYRYPARYVGSEAASQPVPDERVPAPALQRGHRLRVDPSEPPAVVIDVEADDAEVLVRTTDGRSHRYPSTTWQLRVHDERYVPYSAEAPRRHLRSDRSIALER